MKTTIDVCKGCGYIRGIVNKKYYLCSACNAKRLHPNATFKRINRMSDKKKEQTKELHKVYDGITGNCFFCGSPNNLTNAHIVRRSYSERLITEKDNIVHACMRCHNILDNGTVESIKQLPNLDKLMFKMKELDETYYELFRLRLKID